MCWSCEGAKWNEDDTWLRSTWKLEVIANARKIYGLCDNAEITESLYNFAKIDYIHFVSKGIA